MADSIDISFLKQAIEISKQARPSEARYSVGAVLVDQNRNFVSSGFTQELGDGWHAEAVAIKKALDSGFNPKGATIYSTLEPCSIRNSGKENCAALLIEKEIDRVVFALSEPLIFVIGEGAKKLKKSGIRVEQINSLEKPVIEINKHLLSTKAKHKKSKLITYVFAGIAMYCASSFNQALSTEPVNNQNTGTNTNLSIKSLDQMGPVGNFYNQLLRKFGGFDKDSLRSHNLVDSQGRINETQFSKEVDNLPVKDEQVKKSLSLLKGLTYDPSNPAPFFNNLIMLQAMSASAQAQLIPAAEKTLGPKNSYVISLKENYKRTLQYLEALKSQKLILEQTTPKFHK